MSQSRSNRSFRKGSTALQVLEGIDLTGKTFLVTGANSGIGYETTRALALHNAHVVLACRSDSKAAEAKRAILSEKSNAKLDCLRLDCADLQSCEQFAKAYIAKGWKLNCLILNAGLINPTPRVTKDGLEATFQINHLSQFYLVELLMPVIQANAPMRIVVVSSEAHKQASIPSTGLTKETVSPVHNLNSALGAYGLSKLCNILFANELNRRLSPQGITVNSLHPGVVRSEFTSNYSLLKCAIGCIRPFTLNCEEGAATTVYCATASELNGVGGRYYEYCKQKTPTSTARNDANSKKLWSLSEQMIAQYKQSSNKQLGTQHHDMVDVSL